MSAVQRLCAGLAARLRLSSHSQAALQTAARHMSSLGEGGEGSGSSDEEQEQQHNDRPQEELGPEPSAEAEGMGEQMRGRFLMSKELRKLWEEVERADPAALLNEVEKDLQDSEKRELLALKGKAADR
jgi:hypothetical protein